MRYGAMNFPIRPVLEELDAFARLGFDYLELAMDAPEGHYRVVQQRANAISTALARNGMGLICHLPTFVSTADLTAGIREASLTEMQRSIETAAELGAEKLVLHPSAVTGLATLVMDSALALAADALDRLVAMAAEVGVTLCLENMFPGYRCFYDPDAFAEVFHRYPELMLTLDTGHAAIDDPGRRRIGRFIARYGNRIGHVHASDNRGKRDDHLPIGKGRIDFAAVVRDLVENGYDDTITLEVFVDDRRDLVRSRQRMASLLARARGEAP